MSTTTSTISFGQEQKAAFESEVQGRFGVLPNFFQTAADAPGLISELWGFARSAYLDNPMPSVFKERLFVHLSRFCQVRYCIVRHVGFLVGNGHPAGDPAAPPQSVADVVRLLSRPAVPPSDELEKRLRQLESYPTPMAIPEPDTEAEADIFAACGVLFIHPESGDFARRALRAALGSTTLELLTAYLAFIRTAHYWTETHPELAFEKDMEDLMRQHEELARLLLDPHDGARTELSQRLLDELVLLRGERDDRIALRLALADREEAQRHQALLINELNHRVKNTLAIIQSIATQTLRGEDTPSDVRDAFLARLMALADAHDVLTAESWDGAELRTVVTKALASHAEGVRVSFEGPLVRLVPKSAVTLSMAFHELATNAEKYGALSTPQGSVAVEWAVSDAVDGPLLFLTWTETGGPSTMPPARRGFGTRLIERGLAGELDGEAQIAFEPSGVVCTISAPLPKVNA